MAFRKTAFVGFDFHPQRANATPTLAPCVSFLESFCYLYLCFRDRKVLRLCLLFIEFICLFSRQGDLGKLFKPIEPAGFWVAGVVVIA